MHSRLKRPSPALVIAIIALIASLTGTAFAALGKNSVGSKQLKSKAVTAKKLADSAVNGQKVRKESLDAGDIKLSTLGTVPSAQEAANAGVTTTVNGHAAGCPGGTILIRGSCFDSQPKGPVVGVRAAANECAGAGGSLPTVGEMLTVRGRIPLGNGSGTNAVFVDWYTFEKEEQGGQGGLAGKSVVVSDTGAPQSVVDEDIKGQLLANYHYVCRYSLVR